MEEDIKILENYIELVNKGYCKDCNELCNIYNTPAFPSEKIAEAIENLINRNKELEENKLTKEAWRDLANTYKKELDNSISKDILRKDLQHMKNAEAHGLQQLFIKKGIIRYLEELLGGK